MKGLSLAQLHAYIMEVWEEHCLEKRVSKDFKRHTSMFSPGFCKSFVGIPDQGCGAHNRGHLRKNNCSCKKKKKHFYTSLAIFHLDKSYKYAKNKKSKKFQKHKSYARCRNTPTDKIKCFICGKKGHWENKCPKKKKMCLATLFIDDLDLAWWDLAFCRNNEYLEGEIVFLPSEEEVSDDPDTPTLNKFVSFDSSSSESDDPNLGGCGGPPEYSL